MPALLKTNFCGQITWLGINDDRTTGLPNRAVTSLELGFEGPKGESRGGLVRPSCSRVLQQYPRGTDIRNTRQLCLMSDDELALIAGEMGVAALDPALLSVSALIKGIPDFTHLPPSSRLQSESGATLCIDMENRPCHLPAKEIEAAMPGKGRLFKAAAQGRRGVTAWVERIGTFEIGEKIWLHVPDQPAWAHLAEARQ